MAKARRRVRASRRISLNEKQQGILRADFEARYLRLDMIDRLFYSSTTLSSRKRHVRELLDNRYLDHRPRRHVTDPYILYLGFRGVNWIAETNPRFPKEIVQKLRGTRGGEGDIPDLQLRHDLTLSDLYVAAILEGRRHVDIRMGIDWRNSRELELMRLGVQPDAYLKVSYFDFQERAVYEKACFIEFTNQPMKDATSRIEAMSEYMESERYREDFSIPFLDILWLTTSRNKLDRIRRMVESTGGGEGWFFGLLEAAKKGFITERIWRKPGQGRKLFCWLTTPA